MRKTWLRFLTYLCGKVGYSVVPTSALERLKQSVGAIRSTADFCDRSGFLRQNSRAGRHAEKKIQKPLRREADEIAGLLA